MHTAAKHNFLKFKNTIWSYYRKHKRALPWRSTHDPYKILVSEIMLQQTQVPRVLIKYKSFLKHFGSVHALARANMKSVLKEWQGLGYNRRAIYLKRCADEIVKKYNGKFPKDFKSLIVLPGIGPATAGDLMAFAWNIPVPVIETNIRSVFIHFFFKDKKHIHDKDILPLVEKTLDQKNPREWYYALFDYGVYLKKESNPGRQSKHYTKQSAFKGSYREKRSTVLKLILKKSHADSEIKKITGYSKKDIMSVLTDLAEDGFIKKSKSGRYSAA